MKKVCGGTAEHGLSDSFLHLPYFESLLLAPSWWTPFCCMRFFFLKAIPPTETSGSAEQQVAGFAVWWVSPSNQQAEDCGRGMARSFLRPPFMCAYGGSSSRDGRAAPDPAAMPAPDSPLAACWPEGCLSMAAVDVQGEEGELGANDGAGGASELGEGGVCWGTGVCCGCVVEEGGSRGMTSSMVSALSSWTGGASGGLLSVL